MGKRRKTLKEKKISDLRHLAKPTTSEPIKEDQQLPSSFSFPSYSFTTKTREQQTQSFNLKHELLKTFSVSAAITIFQLALFLLLVNHIITLPFGPLQY